MFYYMKLEEFNKYAILAKNNTTIMQNLTGTNVHDGCADSGGQPRFRFKNSLEA